MIGGQSLFINTADENFVLAQQNETGGSESAEAAAEAIRESAFIEGSAAPQVDLKAKFARLKKAMRKRSVSIF
ncbi:MAG: hypothetical protein M3384_00890 [Acidobacteriota bacterium]|nr:hypothetical protein [Acidobacteriota bacterium]